MVSEKRPICPVDMAWLRRMLEVLPPGLRGKLAPYAACDLRRRSGAIRPRVRA